MPDRINQQANRCPLFEAAAPLLRAARRPVLTTHEYPDGDAIGSEIALAEALRALGKSPLVLNAHVTPDVYAFLCREDEPVIYQPGREVAGLRDADLVVVLDANGLDRVGPVGKTLVTPCRPTICIDHHEPGKPFADVHVVDSSASSTSEVVYDLADRLGAEKTRRFAEAVYAGVLFDTGSFRFSNTTPRCHEIVAELIGMGVQPDEMFRRVFESGTLARMRLFGLALRTLESECCGRLAWFLVSKRMFQETGAREQDVEGFVDMVRSIKDAEVVLMFRDNRDGKVKGSFRSKSDAWDMYELAKQFGGGGHRRAAGVTLPGPLEDSARSVVAAARTIFHG